MPCLMGYDTEDVAELATASGPMLKSRSSRPVALLLDLLVTESYVTAVGMVRLGCTNANATGKHVSGC